MKFPLIVSIMCAGLVVVGSVQAGGVKINQRFTGVSHPTMVDTNDDGIFASTFSFQTVGSPGRGTIISVGEGYPPVFGENPCDVLIENFQQSFVETFNDGSMIFFETTVGNTCVNLITSEILGEISGIITGGIGRFKWATGTWSIEFEAFPVGETQTVATGTLIGVADIPK